MMPLEHGLAALTCVLIAVGAAGASAQDCSSAQASSLAPRLRRSAPFVGITFQGEGWTEALRRGVIADVSAELAPHGVAVCTEPAPLERRALARIEVATQADDVQVSIEIEDAVTRKNVSRGLSLSGVPDEARGLTIALAITELLRASWIEIALDRAPDFTRAAPEPVRAIARESVGGRAGSREESELGIAIVFEHSAGGLTQLGGALRFRHWLIDALAVVIGVGARGGLPLVGASGSVDSAVFAAETGLRAAFMPPRADGQVGVDAGAALSIVRFEGHGVAGTESLDVADVAVSVRAGLFGRFRAAGPLFLEATAGVGLPVLGLLATDGAQHFGGIADVEIVTSLAASVLF